MRSFFRKFIDRFFLKDVNRRLNSSFSKIRVEFDEHLDGINQNTNEIQHQYELISNVEHKLDMLTERLEKLSLVVENYIVNDYSKLTSLEKEIFLTLYTNESAKGISTSYLTEKLNIPKSLCEHIIYSLMYKGVDIEEYIGENKSKSFLLAKGFKEKQVKENILNIDEGSVVKFINRNP